MQLSDSGSKARIKIFVLQPDSDSWQDAGMAAKILPKKNPAAVALGRGGADFLRCRHWWSRLGLRFWLGLIENFGARMNWMVVLA